MRRAWLAIGGSVALLTAALLFVPAQFVADRIEVDSPADLVGLAATLQWVPVWRLGPADRGRYELLGPMLVGELCLIAALSGCGLLVAIRRRSSHVPGPTSHGGP